MFWLRKATLELGHVVVAPALHQQHAGCNKTSPVNSFGTEMQHRWARAVSDTYRMRIGYVAMGLPKGHLHWV